PEPAADVFSLGCVVFECITGKPAFPGEHVMAALAKILFDEPPRLRHVCPSAPEALDALVARMLAKRAEARFKEASSLLAARGGLDELRPASMPSPPVARGEQQLVSVLMATAPPGPADPTHPAPQTPGPAGSSPSPSSPDTLPAAPSLMALRRDLEE